MSVQPITYEELDKLISNAANAYGSSKDTSKQKIHEAYSALSSLSGENAHLRSIIDELQKRLVSIEVAADEEQRRHEAFEAHTAVPAIEALVCAAGRVRAVTDVLTSQDVEFNPIDIVEQCACAVEDGLRP